MTVSYGGSSITFDDGSSVSSGWNGFKNRIINGAMVIDQRNSGTQITPTDAQYSVDRWQCLQSTAGKYRVQQVTDAPAGFINSLRVTSNSAYTSVSSDYHAIGQNIEGYNFADMAFGTASASPVTLSFWVKSSLTGNFSVLIKDNNTYSYGTLYTINQANTWEKKIITISGYTGGGWTGDNTNAIALKIWFDLGAGSTYLTSANSWNAGNHVAVSGGTKLIATSGATWQITGVQFEKGSTASSFEYRPYGAELQLCQRYYEIFEGQIDSLLNPSLTSTNYGTWFLKVEKRVTPTVTQTGLGITATNALTRSAVQWYGPVASYFRISTATASSEL
jgi:hypothetical protein